MTNYHDLPTPQLLADACLNRAAEALGAPPQHVLDIGAGYGQWGFAARKVWAACRLVGVEIQSRERPSVYNEWYEGDYFRLGTPITQADVFIGNPPFKSWADIVARTADCGGPDIDIFLLLRWAVWAGVKRYQFFWPEYRLYHADVIVPRPSFTGKTSDQKTDYGLFHWMRRGGRFLMAGGFSPTMGAIKWR